MTLREAARRLQAVATEAREIAARVEGIDEARWAIAVDLRATAYSIDRLAVAAERAGQFAGEPEPESAAVPVFGLQTLEGAVPADESTEVVGR